MIVWMYLSMQSLPFIEYKVARSIRARLLTDKAACTYGTYST